MAVWDVYLEVNGSPCYAVFENETEDEDATFEQIIEEVRGTLQIDLGISL